MQECIVLLRIDFSNIASASAWISFKCIFTLIVLIKFYQRFLIISDLEIILRSIASSSL